MWLHVQTAFRLQKANVLQVVKTNQHTRKKTAHFNLIFFYINCELLEKLFDNKLFFFAWYEVDTDNRKYHEDQL